MEYYKMERIKLNKDFLDISSINDDTLILLLKKKKEIHLLKIPSVSFTSLELIKKDYSGFFDTYDDFFELFIISKKINKEQIDSIKTMLIQNKYKLSTFEYDEILDNDINIYYHNNTIMVYGKKNEQVIHFYKLNDRWYELNDS